MIMTYRKLVNDSRGDIQCSNNKCTIQYLQIQRSALIHQNGEAKKLLLQSREWRYWTEICLSGKKWRKQIADEVCRKERVK